MKKLSLLILIALGLTVEGQNALQLSGGSGHPGDTLTVTLSMTNSDAITALQTFVPLRGHLSYVPGSAILTERSNGHQLTATVLRDTLRLYSYSLSLATFNGTDGDLLTFRVVLGQEPGNYALTPTQSLLSSVGGSALAVTPSSGMATILAPKVQVTPVSIDYGHVPIRSTYTRTVTVRNIGNEPLTLAGVIFNDASLSATPSTATLAAGAQQSVTLTYSPMVAGATTYRAVFQTNARVGDSVVTIVADPYSVNELRPLDVTGYTDSVVTVELRMNNMDSVVGLQTHIVLPSALSYVPGSFVADATRAPGYIATAGMQGDTLTLLLTSMTNTPFHGADGVVARFQVRIHGYGGCYLYLHNTSLSDSLGRNVLSAVYSGYVGIYSPTLSCANSVDFGNTPVTDTVEATLTVSNYGNAPLVIDRIYFLQPGWQVTDSLPMTIGNYGSGILHLQHTDTTEGTHHATMLLYNNDPRSDLTRVSLTAQRYEPNSLYMAGNVGAPAVTPEVDIMLENYSAVTALQMDVQYPYGHFSLNPADISLGSRASGHIVTASRQNDSTLRVLILSMQNNPFAGHDGAVARLQLHALDSTDTASYPIRLSNVTSGCTDGIDRLSSIQTAEWFATRVIHDTTYVDVHDTTYIPVHDTTYIDVHDTTYVPVHDTTYVDVFVHDTTYIDVHDTTYIDVHDTAYIDVHDTTYIPVHDTTYVDVYVHDTTYIDVHDTTYIDVHDTTYIPVHDTTYVDVYIHDTTYIDVHDTTYIDVHDTTYIPVHDTSYVDVYVHDTTIVTDTMWLTQYDTLWLTQTDTLWLHDTIIIHDTIYITGVEEVNPMVAKIYVSQGKIVVEGASGEVVTLYDLSGRVLATKQDEYIPLHFDAPAAGTYLIKVGAYPARKVVLIR